MDESFSSLSIVLLLGAIVLYTIVPIYYYSNTFYSITTIGILSSQILSLGLFKQATYTHKNVVPQGHINIDEQNSQCSPKKYPSINFTFKVKMHQKINTQQF